jgi:hypothetical protein
MLPACSSLLRRALPVGQVAGLVLASAGCFYNDQGLPPPNGSFYFPTGLAVSPERSSLYVANSDFDLQYNGGTVQVLDLAALRLVVGAMLHGVRCTERIDSECNVVGVPVGTTLAALCNEIAMTQPGAGKANGATCTYATDCDSGFCSGGACAACSQPTDCPGGNDPTCPGLCNGGVCMLACVDNAPLTPAACSPISPPFQGSATIGAFASGAVIAQDPTTSGHARLFVPVRGDPSVTWFDIQDDSASAAPPSCMTDEDCAKSLPNSVCRNNVCRFLLDCGQSPDSPRCIDEHRMGVDPYDNFRNLILPVQPVGLDVSDDGQWLVSAHQITGGPAIGLSWDKHDGSRPTFQFDLTSNVPAGPTEVKHIPAPKLVSVANIPYQPGFLVSYNATPEIDIFRVNPDQGSSPPRPFLSRAAQTPVTLLADGKDSRGIALDASERQACEDACGGTDQACLTGCTNIPILAFIANRSPPSLLFGNVETTIVNGGGTTGLGVSDALEIFYPLAVTGAADNQGGSSASKVAIGNAIAPDGKSLKSLVFVVSFDSRYISVFDPKTQTQIAIIHTGRGPNPIAFDSCVGNCNMAAGETPHAYLYVGHFTDSYLGVVDLDMSHPETFGTMFASIGNPIPPLESR